MSLASSALAGVFFTTSTTREAPKPPLCVTSLFLLLLSGFLFLAAYCCDLSGYQSPSWMYRLVLFMKLGNFSVLVSSLFKALTPPLLWYSHYTMLVHLMLSSLSVSWFIVFILLSSILETVLQVCQFMFFYYFSNSWWILRLFILVSVNILSLKPQMSLEMQWLRAWIFPRNFTFPNFLISQVLVISLIMMLAYISLWLPVWP